MFFVEKAKKKCAISHLHFVDFANPRRPWGKGVNFNLIIFNKRKCNLYLQIFVEERCIYLYEAR